MPRVPPGTPGIEAQPNFERYHPFYTDEGYVHIEGLNWVRAFREIWSRKEG